MPSRRSVLIGAGAGMAMAHGAIAAVGARTGTPDWSIDDLLVDGVAAPMGLHTTDPRLSWVVSSIRPGARQTAYRIGVASSAAAAEAGRFDLWDSGRVTGARTFDVPYRGVALRSRQRVWWQVTAWDERGAAVRSTVAKWEMGLLSPEDWTAGWIAAETPMQADDRRAGLRWYADAPAPASAIRGFRLGFHLPEPAQVTVMTACDATADVYLDGLSIARPDRNGWGTPGPYARTIALSAGAHAVALEAGSAIVAQGVFPVKSEGLVSTRAAVLVKAVFADGRIVRFDGSGMQSAAAPTGAWKEANYDAAGWAAARPREGGSPMPARAATLLRRTFKLDGPVASARLYATALGAYQLEINGRRIGDALLRPEFTDYRRTCLYCVEDVTDALVRGDNAIGLHIGDGWYGSFMSPMGRFSFGPEPLRAMAQLEVRYADGRTETIRTGEGWAIAESPITEATIYDGERYDARLEQRGWSMAGFRPDTRWSPAVAAPPATGALIAAVAAPIRRQQVIRPVAVAVLPGGASVVDFGQNFAGWSRVALKGRAGQTVALRHAELVNADGSVDQSNLREAHATDHYTFRGDAAGETYEPRFTYHGFRYVQVEGLDRPLHAGEIVGVPVRSDLRETSDLRVAQHVPQRLWLNSRWSQRSNFMGIPTDCPQRDERLGWTGDAHVFWDAACYNMDAAAFTRRFMRDMRDAQRAPGDFPDIAPNANHDRFTPKGSSPGWADAGVALPWTAWRHFGDTAVIDENWQAMTRYVESIRRINPGLIWREGRGNDFADWLALDAVQPGDPTTPKDLVGTAMWKSSVDRMADMATATGRAAEASRYRAMADEMATAFRSAFRRSDGSIGNGSQTGYILALHFGLLDPAQRPEAVRRLVADIRRRGTLLSTGFLGTPYSLDVLADAGEAGLVYDLLLRTQFPSWGYMIAKGATTTWERWNSDAGDRSMNSFNHYALGAVVGFMFRRIAGIAPLEPGFARILVDPVLDPRMAHAGATLRSRSGTIVANWRRDANGGFSLDLTVPSNTSAVVRMPATAFESIRNHGQILGAGTMVGLHDRDRVVLDLGSGDYRLTSR